MNPKIIRGADLPVSRWLNGAGRKADIASGDGWFIGFAWLEQDAPFSDYAGFDRTITLLEGSGFTLELPAGSTVTVKEAFVPTAFEGAGPIACKMLGGPCRVLNVLSRYPEFSHVVQVVSGSDLTEAEPGDMVYAVVLHGKVGDAGPSDTIRITSDNLSIPSADARVAMIRIERTGDEDE